MCARGFYRLVIASLIAAGPCAPVARGAGFRWRDFQDKSAEWFRGPEGRQTTSNILSHQSGQGDWPKNLDTSKQPYRGERSTIKGTFDNGATVGEVRYLARAFGATGDPKARDAVMRAIDHVLAAQYPNGGFPQHFPHSKTGYDRRITFNDGTMVNLLELLRDAAGADDFAFLRADRRSAARSAFERGIACIVACQVVVRGAPTVWCAQHDEKTLEPCPARTFELVGLSGSESAGILRLLMSLERPGPEVVRAIEGGTRWFDAVKLKEMRVRDVDGDRVVVHDPNAPPLWARFYEVGTNRPFFCGRDGAKKYALAEIEHERRVGYSWYGAWGKGVAERHARWLKKRAKAGGRIAPGAVSEVPDRKGLRQNGGRIHGTPTIRLGFDAGIAWRGLEQLSPRGDHMS